MSNQVDVLLEWCAANGIFIGSQIRIGSDEQGGIGVYATDHYISPNHTLVRIPKDAILSVRTCSLAEFIPVNPYGLGAQLSLSMALYAEILKGRESKWFGYINSFPRGRVDLPIFWGLDANTSRDAAEALNWLTGTEAAKPLIIRNEDNSTKLEEIDDFYHDIAEPLLLHHVDALKPTLGGFHRAFSLVSSRAFLVDAYHGLSMVPIADAFNHIVENQVHLESDYNVCPECGSLQECPHDRDDVSPADHEPGRRNNVEESNDSCYEMVTNAGIPPGAEIFNTYGEKLSNSQLLNQYGFILENNDHSRLVWTMYDIVPPLLPDELSKEERRSFLALMLQVLTALEVEEFETLLSTHSNLVYYEVSTEDHFSIKYEGLSHSLWTILFVLSSMRYRISNTDIEFDPGQMARKTLKLQTLLEALDGNDDEEVQDRGDEALFDSLKDYDRATFEVLQGICRFSIALCGHRIRNSGKPDSGDADLFSVLDELPRDDTRTRLAVSLVISERSILKCCQAGWQSLASHISSTLPGLG